MIEPEQIIEIRDREINTEEIMQRIRERVQRRRAEAKSQGLDYDQIVDQPLSGTAGRLPADLYYELHQLATNADAIGVTVSVRDRRFPILNGPLFKLEELLHRLAVKYVNLLAGRQITINRASAHVIAGLVRAVEQREVRLEGLEKEIAELKERLAHLEHARD